MSYIWVFPIIRYPIRNHNGGAHSLGSPSAEFTLQDCSPDFPFPDSFWKLPTKAPRSETKRHSLRVNCSDWSKSCWCRADAWKISSWWNICSCRGCVREPMRANSPLLSSAVALWTQSYHTSICMQGAQCSLYQNTLTYTQAFQYL